MTIDIFGMESPGAAEAGRVSDSSSDKFSSDPVAIIGELVDADVVITVTVILLRIGSVGIELMPVDEVALLFAGAVAIGACFCVAASAAVVVVAVVVVVVVVAVVVVAFEGLACDCFFSVFTCFAPPAAAGFAFAFVFGGAT